MCNYIRESKNGKEHQEKSVLVGCGIECCAGSVIWLLVLLESSWLLAEAVRS